MMKKLFFFLEAQGKDEKYFHVLRFLFVYLGNLGKFSNQTWTNFFKGCGILEFLGMTLYRHLTNDFLMNFDSFGFYFLDKA